MTAEAWRAFVERQGVFDLAGQAALEVFGDPDPARGAGPDRDHARSAACHLAPTAPDAEMGRLYGHALALARERRDVIERFAATMAANSDRLGGEEVRIALDCALGGRPGPVFRPGFVIRRRVLFEAALARSPLTPIEEAWRLAEIAATTDPARKPKEARDA